MHCRFEDRLAGRALDLTDLIARIEVREPEALPSALDAIEQARQSGYWVALLLDYELGEWLAPETTLPPPTGGEATVNTPPNTPRLTALVFKHMALDTPWSSELPQDATASHYLSSIQPRMAKADYLRQVQAIRELIAAGELYQVNYTQPLDVRTHGDPRHIYQYLAARHPVSHGAYIEDGERTVLSFSPELFVRKEGSCLTVRPMKGTAPRHPDPEQDAKLGQELHKSIKNRAENLMIVDLLRNDLGRLARPGSVHVPALFTLERYPTVWTMTSTVTADVPNATFSQILHALFPCGSITGAPKVAAMRRIRQMEVAPRGLYCGAIGWLAPDGDFSLSVAIRTLVVDQAGNGVYSVGGGIVHDSDPALEWQECLWKARILQDAMPTSSILSR